MPNTVDEPLRVASPSTPVPYIGSGESKKEASWLGAFNLDIPDTMPPLRQPPLCLQHHL